jgi:uncharacterized protein (PEP-CTERM system associated)
MAALLGCLLGPPVQAGEWELTPRIRVSETYTDNVALAESEGEAEYITQVNPGLALTGQGRRAELAFNYQMQNLFYARDPDRNTIYHQGGTEGTLELVRRIFFLDADATRSQQILDPTGTAPTSNVTISDARDDVTTYGGGPRLRYGLGSWALVRAAYRAERVEYGGDYEATTQQTTDVSLVNGPRFNRVGWALSYQRREETRSEEIGASGRHILERGRGELNLLIGPRIQVFAAGGFEDNEYPQAIGADPPEGAFWEAGLRWHPTRHTSLEGSYGKRFFGQTWNAAFNYQGPNTSWELSHSESLVTQTQLQFQRSQAVVRDDEGNFVLDPDGDPIVVDFAVPSVRTQVFLQRRTNGRVAWESGRTGLVLSAFGEEREFQGQGGSEESYGARIRFDWQVASRTNVGVSGQAQRRTFAALDRTDRWWSARAKVGRRLSPSMNLSASYEYLARDSDQGGQDYASQLATVAVSKTF